MKRKVYLDNTDLVEAQQKYWQGLKGTGWFERVEVEEILVDNALGRVTAEPIFAKYSSPHYHASAMDGIAVKAAITFGASETSPLKLLMDEEAFVVDTGDPLPSGCDAVIMIENVNFIDNNQYAEIIGAASPWQHVRTIGEDVVATEMVLPANHVLRPFDLGGILAGGITKIKVKKKPLVAILPTGTELVQPGTDLKPGDIIEYNSRVLGGFVSQWGGIPKAFGITIDDYLLLKERIIQAINEADMVIINAGSSAGREDFTASIIAELGEVLIHGVAIKPGKPVILGIVEGKPVIGVPGYPVSAALTCDLFVRPILENKAGIKVQEHPKTTAAISRKVMSPLGAEEFMRVKLGVVGNKMVATPMSRGAGVIMSLIRADGIVRVPRLSEGYNAGDQVEVQLLRPEDEIKETIVVVGSHDIIIDLLANELRNKYPHRSLSSAHVGSLGGIMALKRGEAHMAGIHLLDEETGDYNVPYVKRLLAGKEVVLINLVYRDQGLMVAKGNPKNISGIEDLAKKDMRFVNRQKGAGTRILLDYKLAQLGIEPKNIEGYEREEFTHMSVAASVSNGSADAALGILAAAKALGLDFVPIAKERYDLLILKEYWQESLIKDLLEILAEKDFQEKIQALGGYGLEKIGEIIYTQ